LLSAIAAKQTMTTLKAIVMKEHKDKKYPHNTQIFSIDWIKKTCWKEIVNLAGYEVTTLIEG
jgi:hypothetical protein